MCLCEIQSKLQNPFASYLPVHLNNKEFIAKYIFMHMRGHSLAVVREIARMRVPFPQMKTNPDFDIGDPAIVPE